MMKVIVSADTDQILGAAILGIEGGEIVQILDASTLARAPYIVLKGTCSSTRRWPRASSA
jgi:pyruvate/2-oxoglutarate dehydrogenase complex dihydrolipoamide dehydrogenase (E3) component